MQSVWSRIWTRVIVSISYDDNHYTTGTSDVTSVIKEVEYLGDLVSEFSFIDVDNLICHFFIYSFFHRRQFL